MSSFDARDLVRTQRELNGELVLAALRAQEETEAAAARETVLLETAELRERLLGILGHDLRTPLGAITMGGGFLLAHGHLTEADSVVVMRLLNSAHRMNRMISQILDFTRTRLGGGIVLDPISIDLGDLCRGVANELSLTTSVHVQCTVHGDVKANADADRLTEMLTNIASNAVEHAWEGTSVALHAYGDGDHVVVEVGNQGDPIPPEVLPFVFEPFRRARQGQYSKVGNLGLGLYIASEIMRAHTGSLAVHSADGKTTFTVRLPRALPALTSSAS